jgi:Mg2+ and Co2+ transporter CorA
MTLKNGFSSSDGAAFAEWMSIYNKYLSSSLRHPPMLGRTVLFIIYDHITRFFELTEVYREMVTSIIQTNLAML